MEGECVDIFCYLNDKTPLWYMEFQLKSMCTVLDVTFIFLNRIPVITKVDLFSPLEHGASEGHVRSDAGHGPE